jgi:hypothetical protein
VTLLGELVAVTDDDIGVGGCVQETAYAVLAYQTVGGAGHKYANSLGRWLARQQEDDGGWLEAGYEYPEADGEALRALASTIGTNVTLACFQDGTAANSSWIREASGERTIPFNGE